MNPMTNVKNTQKLNERELELGLTGSTSSWHADFKDSAWIFVGGLPYDLTEGDVVCVFSQYGEIVHINLVRDKATGKSKGFCFICYEDQRSTILAVDNFNGIKILNRTLRVNHVADYKMPKEHEKDDDLTKALRETGCAPRPGVRAPVVGEEVIFNQQVEETDQPGKKHKKEKKKKKEKKSKKKKSSKDMSESDGSDDRNSETLKSHTKSRSKSTDIKVKDEKIDSRYDHYRDQTNTKPERYDRGEYSSMNNVENYNSKFNSNNDSEKYKDGQESASRKNHGIKREVSVNSLDANYRGYKREKLSESSEPNYSRSLDSSRIYKESSYSSSSDVRGRERYARERDSYRRDMDSNRSPDDHHHGNNSKKDGYIRSRSDERSRSRHDNTDCSPGSTGRQYHESDSRVDKYSDSLSHSRSKHRDTGERSDKQVSEYRNRSRSPMSKSRR